MSAAAPEAPASPRADPGALVRWPASLALVLALHAAAVSVLLRRPEPAEPFAPPLDAVMVDLAPEPEAPPAVEEAPAPAEPEPVEAPPEPEPIAEVPPEPVAEAPPEPPEERRAEAPPPEPPPEPAAAAAEAALPQPPPPPPPPPPQRPVVRSQTQQRTVAEDRRPAQAEAQAAPVPTPAQPPPPASNAVPTWQGQLLGRLQRFKRYPDAARSRREEGVVHLAFTMDREGRVLAASVSKGSGFPELDAETLALVRRAEPLPPPPAEMPGNPVALTVPVRFSLQ